MPAKINFDSDPTPTPTTVPEQAAPEPGPRVRGDDVYLSDEELELREIRAKLANKQTTPPPPEPNDEDDDIWDNDEEDNDDDDDDDNDDDWGQEWEGDPYEEPDPDDDDETEVDLPITLDMDTFKQHPLRVPPAPGLSPDLAASARAVIEATNRMLSDLAAFAQS